MRAAFAGVPPLAFDTRDADLLPQPVVERRSRQRVRGRPRRSSVLERERCAGQAGLQSPAAHFPAPLLAEQRFDQPRLVAIREVRLHVGLRLRADSPGKRRADLHSEFRQIDTCHLLEACVAGPAAVPQFSRPAIGPARELGAARDAHVDERAQPDAVFFVDFILSMRQRRREAAAGKQHCDGREAARHDGSSAGKAAMV